LDYEGAAWTKFGSEAPEKCLRTEGKDESDGNGTMMSATLTGGKARGGEGQRGTKRVGATNQAPKRARSVPTPHAPALAAVGASSHNHQQHARHTTISSLVLPTPRSGVPVASYPTAQHGTHPAHTRPQTLSPFCSPFCSPLRLLAACWRAHDGCEAVEIGIAQNAVSQPCLSTD
jgi:hypothetical protein